MAEEFENKEVQSEHNCFTFNLILLASRPICYYFFVVLLKYRTPVKGDTQFNFFFFDSIGVVKPKSVIRPQCFQEFLFCVVS